MYQGTMIIQQAKNRTVYDRLESLGSQAFSLCTDSLLYFVF